MRSVGSFDVPQPYHIQPILWTSNGNWVSVFECEYGLEFRRGRVLVHLEYWFILRTLAKQALDYLIHIPSPSSQNSIASAFFLQSSLDRNNE
jgi:hypothetical protein